MLPGDSLSGRCALGIPGPRLWGFGLALLSTSALPFADSLTFAVASHGVLDTWGQCTEPDVHAFSIHTFPTTPPACFQFEATVCTVITGGRPGMVAQALEMSWGCESHFLLEFGKPGWAAELLSKRIEGLRRRCTWLFRDGKATEILVSQQVNA